MGLSHHEFQEYHAIIAMTAQVISVSINETRQQAYIAELTLLAVIIIVFYTCICWCGYQIRKYIISTITDPLHGVSEESPLDSRAVLLLV